MNPDTTTATAQALTQTQERNTSPDPAHKYEMKGDLHTRLNNTFTYHAPQGDQGERYTALRAQCRSLAESIIGYCPPGREQAVALTKLEESMMWANAAIARGE